jgi:hypothetical protein
MTETPDETETPETTPPPEWTTPSEEEQAEQDEQEQTSARAAASHGSDEIPKRLERAINDQRRRLSKIVGVDLAGRECPTCEGMGYTIGGSDPASELVHPDNLVMCEACNGYGQVETGSKNPQHVTTVCIDCSGFGYLTKAAQPSNVTPLQPQQTSSNVPVMGFMNPDGTFTSFGVNTPTTVPQSG